MAKTTAYINGIIVDAFYDDPWFDDIIGKGIITPSSRFIYQVASATEGLEIHVNSYGGSVFAANSMIIALKAWASAHPDAEIDIFVESIALSAAANFIAMAPPTAKIHAYDMSLIMFHSCATETFGGPGAHKDAADLMEKINGTVKAALANTTTLDKATVDEWFQEGRMGWLTAEDATACHLIDDILDGTPEAAPEKTPEDFKDSSIAAYYSGQQSLLAAYQQHTGGQTMPTAEDEDNKKTEEEEQKTAAQQEEEEGKKDGEEEKKDDTTQQEEEEGKKDGEEEKKDPEQQGQAATPEQQPADILAQLESRIAQLAETNDKLQQQLDEAEKTIDRLTAGLHAKGGKSATASAPKTFDDLVKTIDPKLPAQEWVRQYLQLKHDNPTLFEQTYNMQSKPEDIH